MVRSPFSMARVRTQPAIVSIHPYNAVPLLGLQLVAGEPGLIKDTLPTELPQPQLLKQTCVLNTDPRPKVED